MVSFSKHPTQRRHPLLKGTFLLRVISRWSTVKHKLLIDTRKDEPQDPVLEFNKLDGNTALKTVMNVDFGFVNVCYDGTNKKTVGLIGDRR